MSSAPTPLKPLAPVLEESKKRLLSSMPPEMTASITSTAATLAASYTPSPLPVGAVAPTFVLPNATGSSVALSDMLRDNAAVVLVWYRGSWCPYCNIALRSMIEALPHLRTLGAKVVALSPETPDESLSTAEKNDLPFEVLSDDALAVADQYGIAYDVPEDLNKVLNDFGVDFAHINGNAGSRKPRLPLPATFVIGKDGKIAYVFAELDYTKRAEPADVIDAVKAVVQ